MRAALRYQAGDGRVEDVADPPVRGTAAAVRTAVRGCEVADGHRAAVVRRVSRDAGVAGGGRSGIRMVGTFACAGGSASAAVPVLMGPVLTTGLVTT